MRVWKCILRSLSIRVSDCCGSALVGSEEKWENGVGFVRSAMDIVEVLGLVYTCALCCGTVKVLPYTVRA